MPRHMPRPRTHGSTLIAAAIVFLSTPAVFALPEALLPITEPASDERVGASRVPIDVTGIPSMDGGGSPLNTVLHIWIGPFNFITGTGWDVVLQTLVPGSRRRDITVAVRNSANLPFSGFAIQPGGIDPTPGGPTPYQSEGIRKLADSGIPSLMALEDGLIRLEFGETRDEAPGVADALWVSGTITLQAAFPIPPIPAPSAVAVFAFAACIGGRRRPHAAR